MNSICSMLSLCKLRSDCSKFEFWTRTLSLLRIQKLFLKLSSNAIWACKSYFFLTEIECIIHVLLGFRWSLQHWHWWSYTNWFSWLIQWLLLNVHVKKVTFINTFLRYGFFSVIIVQIPANWVFYQSLAFIWSRMCATEEIAHFASFDLFLLLF